MVVTCLVTHQEICQGIHRVVEAYHLVDLLMIVDVRLKLLVVR